MKSEKESKKKNDIRHRAAGRQGFFLCFCTMLLCICVVVVYRGDKKEGNTVSTVYSDILNLNLEDFLPEEDPLDGYLLIDEDFSKNSGVFNFHTGSSVSGGTLFLTKRMEDYRTSVLEFDASVFGQPKIEVRFDYKTYLAADKTGENRTGIEFRDMYGRLLFAVGSGEGGKHLYFATAGYDSDSFHCDPQWEPDWQKVPIDPYEICEIRLKADFDEKVVSYRITGSDGEVLVEQTGVPVRASGLLKMVCCNYYTNGGTGTQAISDFQLAGAIEHLDLPLKGKTVYAFGDSIAAGYRYWTKYETEVKQIIGFVEFTAKKEGMKMLYNGAVSGSTLMPGSEPGYIVDQIAKAPEEQPDYIIFDGGINDSSEYNDGRWGVVTDSRNHTFDTNTVAGNFENLIYEMKKKWPDAQLVYVSVQKVEAGRASRQEMVHNITTAACEKWGVKVVDLYNSEFDARKQDIRWNYTYEQIGYDMLPGTMETLNEDAFTSYSPTGLHPNYLGIEKYYVPAVSAVLRGIELDLI